MTTTESFRDTVAGWINDTSISGLRFVTQYESATGPTVTPPAGTLRDTRGGADVAGEFDLADGKGQAVVIDSWGSQASRMEAAVEEIADRVGFPLVRFYSPSGDLLTTSVRMSHRHADATWRGSRSAISSAGIPFEEIQSATTGDAQALLAWFPTALLFGWWHSHTRPVGAAARKAQIADRAKIIGDADVAAALSGYAPLGEVARSARVVTAEIVAYQVHRRLRMAARVDSLFGPLKGNMSKLGLGSLPPVHEKHAPVDVTFSRIEGYWYFSLAGLRRYGLGNTDAADAGALLVGLALLLRATAQRRSRLRAGAELVVLGDERAELLVQGGVGRPFSVPTYAELCTIVRDLGARVGWGGAVDIHLDEGSFIEAVLNRAESAEGDG